MAHVPVGLAGPLLMQGTHAQGEVRLPLSTTDGARAASYSRGMKAITLSGGAKADVLDEGVQLAPYSKCTDLATLSTFLAWVLLCLL